MKSIKKFLLLQIFLILFTNFSFACGPCEALSNITQTINGSNLELTFTSNAGWECCYTVEIEIVCANADFSGIANHFSDEICINGGNAASAIWPDPVPYPLTVIDISNLCPGDYKWRGMELGCFAVYTLVFTFTVVVDVSLSEDTICLNNNTQLTAISNGCNNGTVTYFWSPSVGLNNPNIANPVATPLTTTTYLVTVTEDGSCTVPQTASLTVTVNPLPTAIISGTIDVCQNDNSPILTITGADATGPYTINYTLNGNAQTAIIANPTTTITVLTGTDGTYTYSLTSIQDASSTECINTLTGSVIVTVNELPIVNAGIDQILCCPNDITPSEVVLNGSGALTYTWNNGVIDGGLFTPPTGTTTYIVTGTDGNGCTDTAYVTIQIQEDIIYYVPNTFTPDGDVFNHTFQPIFTSGFDPFDYTLLIFNRWGEIIFESHNADIGWNGNYGGEDVQDGVYTWKIEFKTTQIIAKHYTQQK